MATIPSSSSSSPASGISLRRLETSMCVARYDLPISGAGLSSVLAQSAGGRPRISAKDCTRSHGEPKERVVWRDGVNSLAFACRMVGSVPVHVLSPGRCDAGRLAPFTPISRRIQLGHVRDPSAPPVLVQAPSVSREADFDLPAVQPSGMEGGSDTASPVGARVYAGPPTTVVHSAVSPE